MVIETKYCNAEIKAIPDESTPDKGIFEGYANIFGNIDSGNDIVHAGAFTKTLQEPKLKKYALLYMHDRYDPQCLLGGAADVKETEKGLFSKNWISLKNNPVGAHIFDMIREGIVDRESIGYKPVKTSFTQEGDRDIRHLWEVELKEITVCPRGMAMNDQALITAVKSFEDICEYIEKNKDDLEFKNKILSLLGIKPELFTTLSLNEPEKATTLKTNDEGFISLLKKQVEAYTNDRGREGFW
jgi:hypothetical protein